MTSLTYYTILIITILTSNLLKAQEITDWELVKKCDGIKVYSQKDPDSQLKKIKIETIVEASLSELITIFKDAKNHSNWVYLNKNAEIAEIIDDYNWVYYSFSNPPWPVSNRDYYTKVVLEQNKIDSSMTLTSIAFPNFKPELKDCVRIQFIHSVWKLNPIGNGSIHVIFELEIDPGGNIPIWVVNLVITKGPYNTITGLINELNTNKYGSIKLEYIKEM